MKKLIALLLAAMMVLSLAACGNNTNTDGNKGSEPAGTTTGAASKTEAPVDVLTAIWNGMGEDFHFPCMGGDADAGVSGAPGVATDKEFINAQLKLPEALNGDVVEVASMMHMMNANTFTGAAYKLAEGKDAKAFAEAVKTAIQGTQWMCGFPEKLLIANVAGNIVVTFGAGDLQAVFHTQLTTIYSDAEVITYEELM